MTNINSRLSLYLFLYKITSLLAGVASIYMGYRLFLAGVFDQATLTAAKGEAQFSLQNAAPGTFFALFGTVVIGAIVWRGLGFETSEQDRGASKSSNAEAKADLMSVWNGLSRLVEDEKLSSDDLVLIRLNLAALASKLQVPTGEVMMTEESSESSRKKKFRGFAAPPS
jgi:hypothetical protein